MSRLRLTGYRYSVYTRSVRLALAETGRQAEWQEADPFGASGRESLRGQHPFARVPVLWDGDFRIYETGAILTYLMRGEHDRKRRARARQVAGIADAYAYWPLVRQVFGHAVFRPAAGLSADRDALAEGLAAAPAVLDALDEIAAEGLALDSASPGAADCHLAPMIGYFLQAEEARGMMARAPALGRWFEAVSARQSWRDTRPGLPQSRDRT